MFFVCHLRLHRRQHKRADFATYWAGAEAGLQGCGNGRCGGGKAFGIAGEDFTAQGRALAVGGGGIHRGGGGGDVIDGLDRYSGKARGFQLGR